MRRRLALWALLSIISWQMLGSVTNILAADPGDEFWSSEFFHAGVQGNVYAALSEPDALYVGGIFPVITSVHVSNVARLEFVDGVVNSVQPLGAGLNRTVKALCRYEGDLVATGYFDHSGTTQLDHVGRWDGQAWHPMGEGLPDNVIGALAEYQGQLFAGAFRWDGTSWSNFFETNDSVTSLVVDNGLLYVGGSFTQVRGQDVAHVFAWDGADIVMLAEGLPGEVVSVAVGPQGIAFGWNQAPGSGQVTRWTGSAWVTEQDSGAGVNSVAYLGDDLIVSNVNYYGTFPYFYIVTHSLRTNRDGDWAVVGGFGAELLVEHDGVLMLATDSNVEAGVVATGLLGFDGENFHTQFPPGTGCDTGFNQLARFESGLVASGSFSVAGGQVIDGCGLWYEGNWFGWDNYDHTSGADPMGLEEIEAVGTEFFGLMSYFEYDIIYSRLMKLYWETDRWVWKQLPLAEFAQHWKLQAVGEELYSIGDGVAWIDKTVGFSIPVAGLDLDGWVRNSCEYLSSLVICGNFTTNAGEPVSNVLRYANEQWVSVGDPLPGQVEVIAAMDGQRLAAVVYGENMWQVAIFDGQAWTVLPGEFERRVVRLTFHRDRLFAAGEFDQVGAVPAPSIVVWTGGQWAPIGSGLFGPSYHRVYDMISTGDRLWVTGNFTSAGGHPSVGLAQWSGDPALITGAPSAVGENLPASAGLWGAPYPNPFNPRTELAFQLAVTTPVQVGVFDLRGSCVRELTNEVYGPGTHRLTWNGLDDSGRALPSGVYFARLMAGQISESVKLTLVR